MIRFKDKTIEEYFICPLTGDIFDKDGVVQKTYLHQGYLEFKKMPVHCIQAHTAWGYKPGFDVHHRDENPMNNALSNLDYSMTHGGHSSKTNKGRKHTEQAKKNMSKGATGKRLSEEAKIKIGLKSKGRKHSEITKKTLQYKNMGKNNPAFGKLWWNNGIEERSSKVCPGSEWKRGRLPRN